MIADAPAQGHKTSASIVGLDSDESADKDVDVAEDGGDREDVF